MKMSNLLDQIDVTATDVAATLNSFSVSARVLESDWTRLTEAYANKWVGIFDGKVEVAADSLEDVVQQIERKAIAINQTIVGYIERQKRTLVL
jgi:hypothetical protein